MTVMSLCLRRARATDCRLLWAWANDQAVRAVAFNSDAIAWQTHVAWFDAHLQSDTCVMYVADTGDGIPVGQVRFDIAVNGEAEVDLSLAADWRGHGLGSEILRLACEAFRRQSSGAVVARVLPENRASVRTFEKVGFQQTGRERSGRQDTICMVLAASMRATDG